MGIKEFFKKVKHKFSHGPSSVGGSNQNVIGYFDLYDMLSQQFAFQDGNMADLLVLERCRQASASDRSDALGNCLVMGTTQGNFRTRGNWIIAQLNANKIKILRGVSDSDLLLAKQNIQQSPQGIIDFGQDMQMGAYVWNP
ncbi:MAG: hypothetical protein MUC97_01960 [Bernardetiaceae bacterium]|jgi:hypothetical protein|nr:hypothetical protein [Bernardetiaceae bacterium]